MTQLPSDRIKDIEKTLSDRLQKKYSKKVVELSKPMSYIEAIIDYLDEEWGRKQKEV